MFSLPETRFFGKSKYLSNLTAFFLFPIFPICSKVAVKCHQQPVFTKKWFFSQQLGVLPMKIEEVSEEISFFFDFASRLSFFEIFWKTVFYRFARRKTSCYVSRHCSSIRCSIRFTILRDQLSRPAQTRTVKPAHTIPNKTLG